MKRRRQRLVPHINFCRNSLHSLLCMEKRYKSLRIWGRRCLISRRMGLITGKIQSNSEISSISAEGGSAWPTWAPKRSKPWRRKQSNGSQVTTWRQQPSWVIRSPIAQSSRHSSPLSETSGLPCPPSPRYPNKLIAQLSNLKWKNEQIHSRWTGWTRKASRKNFLQRALPLIACTTTRRLPYCWRLLRSE